MAEAPDTNAAVWKTDQGISHWMSTASDREARYAQPRRLMVDLLPFADDERFTFIDLGAGTGAAARAVLDRYSRAHAVLADFSPQMMEQGAKALAPYYGSRTSLPDHGAGPRARRARWWYHQARA